MAQEDWSALESSGLLRALQDSGDLIRHETVEVTPSELSSTLAIIRPELIPFLSYPYEWSFSMLKDAALLTLKIHRAALERGMILKDASAYNIQFMRGRPILIDTLSFGRWREGTPWTAYRQFCRHFLAPLALMAKVDPCLGLLSRDHLDGVPLETASRILPWRTRLSPGLLTHLHLHAAGERRWSGVSSRERAGGGMSRLAMMAIAENLEQTIMGLKWTPRGTAWAEYDGSESYGESSLERKAATVARWLAALAPETLWDLGANTGRFGRLAPKATALVVAWDIDPSAVERNYLRVRQEGDSRVLPLLVDLANPSPALGWMHRERRAMLERGPVDAVLALALVHHLALGNNLPLPMIAEFLASAGRAAIVEFIPAEDPQAAGLMAGREELFPDYRLESFLSAVGERFEILDQERIDASERTLLLLKRR